MVLPQNFKSIVYRELHEEMGHLGVEGILALARERFYWPNLRRDVEHYIYRRCRCLKQKRPYIQPIVTTAPSQLLFIAFVHLERSFAVGYEYILVEIDHFTKYA